MTDPHDQLEIDEDVQYLMGWIKCILSPDDLKMRHIQVDLMHSPIHRSVLHTFQQFGKWNPEKHEFEGTPNWDVLLEELLKLSPTSNAQ